MEHVCDMFELAKIVKKKFKDFDITPKDYWIFDLFSFRK